MLAFLNRIGGESDNLLFGEDEFHLTEAQEADYIAFRAAGPSCLLLGFSDGALVSVGSLEAPPRPRLAHTAELALTVARSHWGLGVGRAMMAALVGHARAGGALTLLHLGVRADNERAIGLYRQFGFVKSGLLPGFLKVGAACHDEITMTLDLRQESQNASPITFREALLPDLPALLSLYEDLHEETPLSPEAAGPVWRQILRDPGQCVILGEAGGEVVASCVLVVAPNLTRGGRPWAVVENVVVAKAHRRKGWGLALLAEARSIAFCVNCYKIMLYTGRRDEATLAFYRAAGFESESKTAFLMRL